METSAKVAWKDFCLKGIFSVFFDPIATRSWACLGIICSYTLSYCVYHQRAKFFLANMVFLGASALSLTYEIYAYVTSVIQQILGYACANSKVLIFFHLVQENRTRGSRVRDRNSKLIFPEHFWLYFLRIFVPSDTRWPRMRRLADQNTESPGIENVTSL